jgi:hypothetical protein
LKLRGVGVKKFHATFVNANGKVTFKPEKKAACILNGKACTSDVVLTHNDRLRLGEHNYFRFLDPVVMKTMSADQVSVLPSKNSCIY